MGVIYEDLKKEFEKKVKELQKKCPHKKIRDWMWSFRDRCYIGYKVKICEFCNKTLRRKKDDFQNFLRLQEEIING